MISLFFRIKNQPLAIKYFSGGKAQIQNVIDYHFYLLSRNTVKLVKMNNTDFSHWRINSGELTAFWAISMKLLGSFTVAYQSENRKTLNVTTLTEQPQYKNDIKILIAFVYIRHEIDSPLVVFICIFWIHLYQYDSVFFYITLYIRQRSSLNNTPDNSI